MNHLILYCSLPAGVLLFVSLSSTVIPDNSAGGFGTLDLVDKVGIFSLVF